MGCISSWLSEVLSELKFINWVKKIRSDVFILVVINALHLCLRPWPAGVLVQPLELCAAQTGEITWSFTLEQRRRLLSMHHLPVSIFSPPSCISLPASIPVFSCQLGPCGIFILPSAVAGKYE